MENIKDLRSTGGTKPVRYSNNNKKLKDAWNCNNNNNSSSSNHSYGDEDYLGGFSWPPRSYTCSFCKREFRSAQALGGHMNVHRRDRARLRVQQSPPKDGHQYSFLNLNINPNPNANPNPNISTPSMNFSPSFTCTLPTVVSSPLSTISSPSSSVSPTEIKKWGKDYGDLVDPRRYPNSPKFKSQDLIEKREEKGVCKFSKKSEIVKLDLEIGLISDEPNEDLDLELRLGYA